MLPSLFVEQKMIAKDSNAKQTLEWKLSGSYSSDRPI